jgi:hypothetical protein
MNNPLDRQLATIFRGCEDYYLTNLGCRRHKRSEAYKLMHKTPTAVLTSMAAMHAALYPGFKADKDHSGYLIKFEPPIFFRIPYHVLPTFPTGQELELLWELSREIRSGSRSLISLSDSNVMRRYGSLSQTRLCWQKWHYPRGTDRPTKELFATAIDCSKANSSTWKGMTVISRHGVSLLSGGSNVVTQIPA